MAHIPTLQEYAKKRKRLRDELSDIMRCCDCDYYRKDVDVCLWNDNVREITRLQTCPITNRDL